MFRFLVVLIFFISTSVFAEDISVLGLDQEGHSVVQVLSEEDYLTRLQGALQGVHDSIVPVLQSSTSLGNSEPRPSGKWKLRTISVGTGLAGQIGPAPLLSATARGRFRMVYTNSKTPIFPD